MIEEAVEAISVQELPMLDFEAGNAGRVVGSPVVLDIFGTFSSDCAILSKLPR